MSFTRSGITLARRLLLFCISATTKLQFRLIAAILASKSVHVRGILKLLTPDEFYFLMKGTRYVFSS